MSATTIKDGFAGGSDNQLKVNVDGSINTVSSGGGGSNASVGLNHTTPPTSSTQIAGVDTDGNFRPISVDDNGFINVSGTSTVSGTITTKQDGLDTFRTTQYVVGMSEIEIASPALPSRSSISLKVQLSGTNTIYFSNAPGTALSSGYPLVGGDSVQLDLTPTGRIYVVGTANDLDLFILEIA